MALEFPNGFPFNRKPAKDEAAELVSSLRLMSRTEDRPAAMPKAMPVEAMVPQSKADLDFEAAIDEAVEMPMEMPVESAPVEAPVQHVTATPAEPRMRIVPATQPDRPLSPAGVRLARAVAESTGPNESMHSIPARERRRAPRQTLVAKATVRCESQSVVVATGFMSNISMAGVGFHTRKPLRIGQKYQLRLEVGPMKWASRMRIVTCTQHGDTYDVGAEFVGNELASLARRELAA